jgi:hypothetical protein
MKLSNHGPHPLYAGTLLFLVAVAPAMAADVGGYWKGAITLPSAELEVSLTFTSADDGWSARLDIPIQGIRQMEMDNVAVDGSSVTCRMPGVPGEPTFHGTLAEDGNSIEGKFLQNGQSFQFNVARAEPPADADIDIYADYVKPGVPGEGLAATWNGLLHGGPAKLRTILEITSSEAGLTGVMVVVDQGGARIPISAVTLGEGSAVRFEAPMVGGIYEGKMSPDGAELYGTWSQSGQKIPLDFHRVRS